jgi:hypothetical protein
MKKPEAKSKQYLINQNNKLFTQKSDSKLTLLKPSLCEPKQANFGTKI